MPPPLAPFLFWVALTAPLNCSAAGRMNENDRDPGQAVSAGDGTHYNTGRARSTDRLNIEDDRLDIKGKAIAFLVRVGQDEGKEPSELPGRETHASPSRLLNIRERKGSTMAEQRETYKGREILIRPRTGEPEAAPTGGADAARAASETTEPELLIDGKPVFTIRNSSGAYIAGGHAFEPQTSLVELAKRLIDSREPVQ
jgi:hypothetical protein